MDQEKIGKFISEKRKEKGITQNELAEKLNVTNKSVSNWENGKNMPDISLMQDLCSILDISLNELFNGESNKSDKGLINYLKEEKKKRKRRLIISIISIILILVISLLLIFFINNYNKVNGYILTGESDNFSYDRNSNLVILSNMKNIASIGNIHVKNGKIKESDIVQISLKYQDEVIIEGNYLTGVFYENNGYDEIFSEDARNNINNWYIEVIYNIDNEEKKEIIKLDAINILSNDKVLYTKQENISDLSPESIEALESAKKSKEEHLKLVKDKLLKNGYTWAPITAYTTSSKTTMKSTTLIKTFDDKSYMKYRTEKGKWEYYDKDNNKYTGFTSSRIIIGIGFNGNGKNCYYSMKSQTIYECDSAKANVYYNKFKNVEKLYKREFAGVYYYKENEYIEDQKID